MIQEFSKYVRQFNIKDENLKMRYKHSLRVSSLCMDIALHENFSNKDMYLARLIGLLHDYGRFLQWDKYQTFNDSKSIDHALLAAEELFENKKIIKYSQDKTDYLKIKQAIYNHNKLKIKCDKEALEMCQIVRDADKIDLLYLLSQKEDYIDVSGEPSEEVEKDFFNHELIKKENVKTPIDKFLLQLAWIYDINYKYSFYCLKSRSILDKIYNKVKDKRKIKPYIDEIQKYLKTSSRKENINA